MRLLYFGDGKWAQLALEKIVQHDAFKVAGVVLRFPQQDLVLREIAEKHNIPVFQFEKVNNTETIQVVKNLQVDLGVSMSFDQIIGKSLRQATRMGFINCHAGKLPNYRGRNIINWALINDEKEFGITVHFIDDGIDTGDIITQSILPISQEDDYGSLLQKAYEKCPELLLDALVKINAKNFTVIRQSHLPGSYFSFRRDGDELIDWNWPAKRIYNLIRAITKPGPGAYTYYKDEKIHIWKASLLDTPPYLSTPGEVIGVIPEKGCIVKTGDTAIVIETISRGSLENTLPPEFSIGSRLGFNIPLKLLELEKRLGILEKRLMGDE